MGDGGTLLRGEWFRLSVAAGNALQIAGLAAGFAAIHYASRTGKAGGIALMLAGWVLVYFCCHAIAHWFAGRLLGIRFRFYTVAGTEKPERLPRIMRGLFTRLPFLGVRTERASMDAAAGWRKAAMWSAGVTSSVVLPIAAAAYAMFSGAPGGQWLLLFAAGWSVGTIHANLKPGGDFWKAKSARAAASATAAK